MSFNESNICEYPHEIFLSKQIYNLIYRDTKHMFTILPYTYVFINVTEDRMVPNKHKAVFDWQNNREL